MRPISVCIVDSFQSVYFGKYHGKSRAGEKDRFISVVLNLPVLDITKSSPEKISLSSLLGCCRFWQIYSRAHWSSDSVSGKRKVDTTEIGRHENE